MNGFNFEESDQSYRYSPMGRNYGDPMLNVMSKMLFGQNYMPKPESGQDMYDAFLQRQRTGNFLQLQKTSFANNILFQRAGVSGNSMLQGMGSLFGSPDGALGKMMSPLIGGNPMAASMGLYASMTGPKMSGFRPGGAITMDETTSTMQSLMDSMYTTQKYGGQGGIKETLDKQGRDFIRQQYARGPEGQKYLADVLGKDFLKASKEGKLSAEDEEKISKLSFTESETGEASPLAKQLKNRRQDRAITSGGLEYDLDQMLKTDDEKVKKQLSDNLKEKLQKTLAGNNDALKKAIGTSVDKQGILDPGKVTQFIQDYKKLDPLERLQAASEKYKQAGQRYVGMDLANTRGFKLEDITSGFQAAAKDRMLGDTRGMSVSEAMGGFSKNAMGTMSAARSFFGDLPPDKLMSKISDLMGTSGVDLKTEEGNRQVEDKLRQLQATARVSGVSNKSMMGFISGIRDAAASSPQLQNMNASAAANLGQRAMLTSADLAGVMTADEYRARGGQPGIASDVAKTSLDYQNSELGSFQRGLLYQAKLKGPEAFKQVQDLVKSGKLTSKNLSEGKLTELQNVMGMSTQELLRAGQNEVFQNQGAKDRQISETMSSKEAMQNVTNQIFDLAGNYGGVSSKEDFMKAFREEKQKNPQLTAREFYDKNLTSKIDPELAKQFESYAPSVFEEMYNAARNPADRDRTKKLMEAQAERAKTLDKEFGQAYSPIATQAMDVMMRGGTVEDMASAGANIFATKSGDTEETKQQMLKARESMAQIAAINETQKLDVDKIKAGLGGEMNTVISARKAAAEARGEGSSVKDLRELSDEELSNYAKYGKTALTGMHSNEDVDKQILEYENMKSRGELTGDKENLLSALYTFKGSGATMEEARQGLAGLSVGTVKGQMEQNKKAKLEALERDDYTQFGESLLDRSEDTNSPQAQELQNILKDYGISTGSETTQLKKLKEDFEKKQGRFKDQESLDKSGVRGLLESKIGTLQSNLEQTAAENLGEPGTEQKSGTGSTEALSAVMQKILDALTGTNSISTAFGQLASALR